MKRGLVSIIRRLELRDWTALLALVISMVALGLNIESRIQDRPSVRVEFDEIIVGYFSDLPPEEFAPETLITEAVVINSGRRGTSILGLECYVRQDDGSYELLNASETIYRTMELPIDVPTDSSRDLEIAWVLGATGEYEQYNHRFSLLPSDIVYELRVTLAGGETFIKEYEYRDLQVIPLDVAQEYKDVLSTPTPQ